MSAGGARPPRLRGDSSAIIQEALAVAASLQAAHRLGVLERLGAGPVGAAALARDCAIGERGASLLLQALATLGLLARDGQGEYRLEADPGLLEEWVRLWTHLPEAIRQDQPLRAYDTPAGAAAVYPSVVPWMGELLAPAAAAAAERLARPGLRILDVGAGAAPWSLALAARQPDVTVVAVDLPAVLGVTRAAVAAAGREGRFQYRAGDVFEVAFGGPYELAIVGNLCHLFGAQPNRHLLGRIFEALLPGGTLAIVDALPNDALDGPRPIVLYALSLLLRTRAGRVYPFSTYAAWLRAAGYERLECYDLAPSAPLSLITARRPVVE